MLSLDQAISHARDALSQPERWTSMIINRRQPVTYRASLMCGEDRICLHKFEACEPADSFAHPHPWPSHMVVLAGTYEMRVLQSPDLHSAETVPVIDLLLGPGSRYSMLDQRTWHQVIPRSTCYSLMVNGPRWQQPHRLAPSTAGKNLNVMTPEALAQYLREFTERIDGSLRSPS